MAAQGFDPDFIFSWPTGRMGVLEGDSAVRAVHGKKLDRAAEEGIELDEDTIQQMEATREAYEEQMEATHAAARGFVDAIVTPEHTREVLDLAIRCSLQNPGPHIGTFSLPPGT